MFIIVIIIVSSIFNMLNTIGQCGERVALPVANLFTHFRKQVDDLHIHNYLTGVKFLTFSNRKLVYINFIFILISKFEIMKKIFNTVLS